jgi:hypothetical protein
MRFNAACAAVLATILFASARAVELDVLQPYIVMLKPKKSLSAVEERVATRSADPAMSRFRANVDPQAVFASNANMPGFRMMSTKEAADDMRQDPDVLIVERDSAISIDSY